MCKRACVVCVRSVSVAGRNWPYTNIQHVASGLNLNLNLNCVMNCVTVSLPVSTCASAKF